MVAIRTPIKVTLKVYDRKVDMDQALLRLGEGTGIEELLIKYHSAWETLLLAKDKYYFSHLKTLSLRGKSAHPLADRIYGPLLTYVELEKGQRIQAAIPRC